MNTPVSADVAVIGSDSPMGAKLGGKCLCWSVNQLRGASRDTVITTATASAT